MNHTWWAYLLWVLGAGVFGLAVTGIFTGRLRFSRRLFVLPYVALGSLFVFAYLRWSVVDLQSFVLDFWFLGVLGALIAGLLVVKNVLSQSVSSRASGVIFVFDIAWLGVIYGLMDALLLNVLPVMATWGAFTELGWTTSWIGRIGVGVLAFASSLFVTATYHLGYPEFQNERLKYPLIGNGVCSLAYLLSSNPIAAAGSHIAMHVAAVFRGPETMLQLPP